MTKIQVEIGCPSGFTRGGWNHYITIEVSEGSERDFVQAIIHHARLLAKEYTLEEDE